MIKMKQFLIFTAMALLSLSFLGSCEEIDGDEPTYVQWKGRARHKNPHDTIHIHLPAKGDTVTFYGNFSHLWISDGMHLGHHVDSVKLGNNGGIPNSRDFDTAYSKHLTAILHRDEKNSACTMTFMAKPNTTNEELNCSIELQVLPISTVTFYVHQPPLPVTAEK